MGKVNQLALDLGQKAARKQIRTGNESEVLSLSESLLLGDSEAIYYMYSGFAMTTLPHKRLDDNKLWKRENGRMTMLVEPGALLHNGVATQYGVPFGSRARLIMFYLQTEAIRQKSPIVHLGSSLTNWMKNMNIPTGGKNFAQVRDQARRLSACRLTVGWQTDSGHSGFRRENIVGAMIIPPSDSDIEQGTYWEETAQLSDGFFQALLDHPVPCDRHAISILQAKSQAIDIYVWLCYRLFHVSKPTTVPWASLYNQFGHSYITERQFRWRFKATLDEALAVYREANVELSGNGLVLMPSKPAIAPRSLVTVKLPEPSTQVRGNVIDVIPIGSDPS